MDCFGAKDCASNFRCVGGRCVEIAEPLNVYNEVAGCGGGIGPDFQLPPAWTDPADWQRCGKYRERDANGDIQSYSGEDCPEGTFCSGNYCVPDWNDPFGEFDWENYDADDPSTQPWDPEDPSTYPDTDENGFPDTENASCGTVPVPVLPPPGPEAPGGAPEAPDVNVPGLPKPPPEFVPPELPDLGGNLPVFNRPNMPDFGAVALSCDDEPNCGPGNPDFQFPEYPEFPDQYPPVEFPEVEFDINDPETWPEEPEFDPGNPETWPPTEEEVLDEPTSTGACAVQCSEGQYLKNGKCQDRPCSKYCTELYQTDPIALLEEEDCPAYSYCTGQCQECAQVPGKPAPGPLLYDKGWCVSKARAQFEDENGDGIPDQPYEPGDDNNPLPYGGVHCKCLKEFQIPGCWKCDNDGVLRPSPSDCTICTQVNDWQCDCGITISMDVCRKGNEAPVSAEAVRERIRKRCNKICPPTNSDPCVPPCKVETFYNPEWDVSNPPCPQGFKCTVVGIVETDGGFLDPEAGDPVDLVVLVQQCDYRDLPARCQCNSVECVCHSECQRCQVCSEEGVCIDDPAAPPECCPSSKKRVRINFKVTEKRYPVYSCDGIEILPEEINTSFYQFDEIGIDKFDLPKPTEVVILDQTCDSTQACLNLLRVQAGKVVYQQVVNSQGDTAQRNWYVGEFYEGNCRATFNRVVVSTIETVGEPIITCED